MARQAAMRERSTARILLLTVALLMVGAAMGQVSSYRKDVTERRSLVLLQPRDGTDTAGVEAQSDELAKSYRALFETVTRSELSRLTQDPDVSLALQARWEIAREKVLRKDDGATEATWGFEKSSLQGFLGFFDQRIGLTPPKWWSDSVLQDQTAAFALGNVPQKNIKVTIAGDHATYLDGIHQITLPYREGDGTSILFQDGLTFVERFDRTVSYPSTLTCFDKNGAERWTRPVWGNFRGGFGGFAIHTVELVSHGNQITVFGSEMGEYAETFDIADGRPGFKFCTFYWHNDPETWHVAWNHGAIAKN